MSADKWYGNRAIVRCMNDDEELELQAGVVARMEELLGGTASVSEDGALVFEKDPDAAGGLLHPKIIYQDDDPSLSVKTRLALQVGSAVIAVAGVHGYKYWRSKQQNRKP